MYEKILAQLTTKHSGVPKVVLGLIAKKLEPKVTEESQIEGAINDFETNSPVSIKDYADLMQSEGDKRVTEALKKAKTDANPNPNPSTPPADPKDVDPKDVASLVAAEIAKALAPIQALTSGLQNKTKLDNLKAQVKAKGIPEDWAEDVVIGDDFDEEATITKLETRWNNTKQAIINKEIDEGRVFKGSSASDDDSLADIKNYASQSSFTKEAGFNIQEV